MNSLHSHFVASSLAVELNAVKNIIFRTATILLEFAILRVFAFIAFQCHDYTSFLIFGEDIIQKALFVFSKGFRRQALLVATFVIFVTAAGFYDTLLWGLDSPGYVLQTRAVDGGTLASQMVDSPAYINYITANLTDPSTQNNLNTTFNANLYAPGLNFTLPGIFNTGPVEVVPPLYPLTDGLHDNGTARIWLDDTGFAVGLDPEFMWAGDMLFQNETTSGICYPSTPPGERATQTWRCDVPHADGLDLLSNIYGKVRIVWDEYNSEDLMPSRADNPWRSIGTDVGTAMMKQVFTVTKGHRRHTFLSTVFKASTVPVDPGMPHDAEIREFMRRAWLLVHGTPVAPTLTTLTNEILYAKGNWTGRTFGAFTQWNTSLLSISTDYVFVQEHGSSHYDGDYNPLRFLMTNITLIRSETLDAAPTPLKACRGSVYSNSATGGVSQSTNCKMTSQSRDNPKSQVFLGQVDTSAVTIINGFLGDGESDQSSLAMTDSTMSWLIQNEGRIDNLLISRALLLGGNPADVTVHVEYTVPADEHARSLAADFAIFDAFPTHMMRTYNRRIRHRVHHVPHPTPQHQISINIALLYVIPLDFDAYHVRTSPQRT